MKDYQRIKGNKYILPRAVYNQAVWLIRDYDRMREEAESIMVESPAPPDGQPRGNGTGDDTFSKAVRRNEYLHRMKVIEESLQRIPAEYRKGIWNNIIRFDRFPNDASRSTYGRHKSEFVFMVALGMRLI